MEGLHTSAEKVENYIQPLPQTQAVRIFPLFYFTHVESLKYIPVDARKITRQWKSRLNCLLWLKPALVEKARLPCNIFLFLLRLGKTGISRWGLIITIFKTMANRVLQLYEEEERNAELQMLASDDPFF